VPLHACDTLLQDGRRAAHDGDSRVAVLQQLYRSQTQVMRAGTF
jgi:hypothetical protein